jgi:hypothetical protein
MKRWIPSLMIGAALSLAAIAFAPAQAPAQCTWGCACMGSSCGCNGNGNGSRCDASGSGCVVTGCSQTRLFFAPDGSVVRLASTEAAGPVAEQTEDPVPRPDEDLGGITRWEAAQNGRSVARHCSGVVVARYYPAAEVAAIRDASRTLRL